MAAGELDIMKLPMASLAEAEAKILPLVKEAIEKIKAQTEKREKLSCNHRRRQSSLTFM